MVEHTLQDKFSLFYTKFKSIVLPLGVSTVEIWFAPPIRFILNKREIHVRPQICFSLTLETRKRNGALRRESPLKR